MLKVLCLVLLMTYRKSVLFALVLLILQFVESPVFNCSQTAAVSLETCALETWTLKINKCSVMNHLVCIWFLFCLRHITEQTCIACSAPSKNEQKTPFSLCFVNKILSLLVLFDVSSTKAGFCGCLVMRVSVWSLCLLSEIYDVYDGWFVGLVHITEDMPTCASNGMGKNILVFLMVPDMTLNSQEGILTWLCGF